MASKRRKGRISAGDIPVHQGKIPAIPQIPDDLVRFSFRYFDHSGDFSPEGQSEKYLFKFLERLKALSDCKVSELTSNRSSSLRFHPIHWPDTAASEGFSHLNEQLQAAIPYQFAISANAYGRVHGFFIDNVFFIVWLDPNHSLYS